MRVFAGARWNSPYARMSAAGPPVERSAVGSHSLQPLLNGRLPTGVPLVPVDELRPTLDTSTDTTGPGLAMRWPLPCSLKM